MTDQEIQAKGLTAPRITPADIEANIASESYFTAADGVRAASQGKPGADLLPEYVTFPRSPLDQVTFCVLVLRNGTKIVGINYGSVDPAQHSAEDGRKYARESAVEQIDSTLRVTRQIGSGPGAFFNVEVGKNWDYSALQPIDTAPTDGTVFLGYRERDRRWGTCYRIQCDDCEMWFFHGSSASEEDWPNFKPTHWMPLPGEPKQMGIVAIDSAVA